MSSDIGRVVNNNTSIQQLQNLQQDKINQARQASNINFEGVIDLSQLFGAEDDMVYLQQQGLQRNWIADLKKEKKELTEETESRKSIEKAAKKNNERISSIEAVKKLAKEAEQKSKRYGKEIPEGVLLSLLDNIGPDDTIDDIMQKIKDAGFYDDDPILQYEILTFLLKVHSNKEYGNAKINVTLTAAKQRLEMQKGVQLRAAENTISASLSYQHEGLMGSAVDFRKEYTSLLEHTRDAPTFAKELVEKYPSTEEKQKFLALLLHALGEDVKKERDPKNLISGPSIERGELHTLITQIKDIQAIIGINVFFADRLKLIAKQLEMIGILPPSKTIASGSED
ncbi:MAG: putative type secreted protein SctW [Chlamydiales bacterium]|jgi:hypothetical protein|nr:putative type secreted protein SctW [Chlamydiales bacterium]